MSNSPKDSHHHDHSELSEMDAKVRALESLLVEKGYVDPEALDLIVETYETKIGPRNGAKVVARAWSDAEFRKWLLEDATAAIASLGFSGRQGEHMVVVENTADIHNMVVCTLCSCYPWSVLGLPPSWYKSPEYRSRAVIDPRSILAEFDVDIGDNVAVHVHDSTAETRYLVLPLRPDGSEGMSEEQLAELVTRNSMIGTGAASVPGGDAS